MLCINESIYGTATFTSMEGGSESNCYIHNYHTCYIKSPFEYGFRAGVLQ